MNNETYKSKYRIRNWKQYNEAMVNRGRIDVWIDEEVKNSM